MADDEDSKADTAAEKAFAAAAEAAAEKPPVAADLAVPAPPAMDTAPVVEFPAKAKRAARAAKASPVPEPMPIPEPTPVAIAAPPAPVEPLPAVEIARPPAIKPRKPALNPKAVAKKMPAPAKPAAAVKSTPIAAKMAIRPARPKPSAFAKAPAPHSKENPMEQTNEFVDGAQKFAAEAQDKTKTTFAKGTAMLGEYGEFAKGNVEAVVASGKILATGLQTMGSTLMAEGKTAFETMTGDVKSLAAVKSPGEFLKLQTDILRRNFDSAMSMSTKNGEAMMKLASETIAPLSGRVTLAVDKLRKAA